MTDFTMFAGNSHQIHVTVTDLETGLPLDLTGDEVKFKASKTAKNVPPEIEKTTADGITVTDAPAGEFTVFLDPDDTFARKGTLYWECDVIETDGRVSTVVTGIVTFTQTLLRTGDEA
jgi:hypothetical protein